jgi:hypothetical protein
MPERLENSFQATINKIKRQSTVKANQGMEILKWTYFAQRPLRIFELRHALVATNSTSDTLDLDDLPFEKSLTECCHGLVIIDRSTSSVRLAHRSIRDFLERQPRDKNLFQNGDRDIARTCLTYMTFKPDESIISIFSQDDFKCLADWLIRGNTIDNIPRMTYYTPISQYFPSLFTPLSSGDITHGNRPTKEVTDLAVKLLLQDEHSDYISTNLRKIVLVGVLKSRKSVELSLEGLHTFSGERFALYLTTYIGTDDIMRTLITRLGSSSVNLRLLGELPLNIAAEQGHLSIVRTLLNSDDIDINARDGHDSTPLFLAIPSGHVEVVRLLQEKGADIDAPNASGLRLSQKLHKKGFWKWYVFFWTKVQILRQLVNLGGRLWLGLLLAGGMTLLLYFWNTAQTCIDGNTPLLKAVSIPSHGSYDGIVRLLLENNADVHALNDRRTPLSLAACYSTETVVRLVGERIRYSFDC